MPSPDVSARGLLAAFGDYGRTLVAFSGGVDSGLVLAAAARALGPGDVAAVTAVSASLARTELDAARRFCDENGVQHHLVRTTELTVPGYRENGPRRCYFCKSTVLDAAAALASEQGFDSVATGTNASDLVAGSRPGIVAGVERAVRTPLADTGLSKPDVRAIARLWGLSTWDKPALACLASRVAYGLEITPARLARVERAEATVRAHLAGRGNGDVRVRDLGDGVRLEVDASILAAAQGDPVLGRLIAGAGFGDLPLVVQEFRSGSMNDLAPPAVPLVGSDQPGRPVAGP
jgi:uncharacterized protein